MRDFAEALLALLNSGERGALATVVLTSGSTPQQAGARLLLRPDGSTVGTVGGGAIEHAVMDALRDAQRTGKSQLLVRNLAQDLGMCCGGRMEIFVEAIHAAPRLHIFGAGHVGCATAPLARGIGFDVSVIDEREELNTPERFPGCAIDLRDPATVLKGRILGENDWILIVTHDHHLDAEILERCLRQEPRYLGLVGSRRKLIRITQRILQRDPSLDFDRVHAPVGLDLGAVGPNEIAISIAAQLVALKRGTADAGHALAAREVRAIPRESKPGCVRS
jgi:xanthine dehydrogenase accessory factor